MKISYTKKKLCPTQKHMQVLIPEYFENLTTSIAMYVNVTKSQNNQYKYSVKFPGFILIKKSKTKYTLIKPSFLMFSAFFYEFFLIKFA